ncbi:MAG TPA: hypothetical protein H9860_00505 [Candidatus Gemmiger faecavium]|nr:hypothetical protein [Candidatus Gemmiger faecavium]
MPGTRDDTARSAAVETSRSRWLWLKIYLPVWIFCAAWYWLGMGGGGWIMAYGILTHLVLLPLATLAASAVIGWRRAFGRRRWGTPVLLSALYGMHLLVTISLSNALGITNIAPLGFFVLLRMGMISLLGLLTGMGLHRLWDAARKK